MDCIFCQIVQNKIPCQKLYEDEHVISFLDIFPGARGHSLVVPKAHYSEFESAPSTILTQVMCTSQKIASALKSTLNASGFNILLNNGETAGQKVPHLHFHILPRYPNDGVKLEPQHYIYQEGELETICQNVQNHLPSSSQEQLTAAVKTLCSNNKLSCAQALKLAQENQISPKKLGARLDELNIKLINCQLGCF